MSRWQRCSQLLSLAQWSLQQSRGAKASITKLPVELLRDVGGIGEAGELVKVNHGYARNYLLPNRMAAIRRGKQSGSVAGWFGDGEQKSSGRGGRVQQAGGAGLSEEELQQQKAAYEQRRLEAVVKKLTTIPLQMRRKTGDDNKLEKPVTAEDIAATVAKQLQIEMVPEMVDLSGETLTVTGEYRLPLKLLLPGGERAMLDVSVTST